MSEIMGDLADIAADALKTAQKQRKSDKGFVGAMANGVGLAAVRLCFLLMTVVVGLAGYIIADKVGGIDEHIKQVDQKVDKVDSKVDGVTSALTGFMKEAATQEMMDRLDIVQLKDRARSIEQYTVKRQ